jgi:ribose 5-phosphate isomerase A
MGTSHEKRAAALHAAHLVRDGMTVGLGSGSTAELAVEELGRRFQAGLSFRGVPTSAKTAALARAFGIPLGTVEEFGCLDLTIDGADEVDPALNLIKGHGGALLREKLVAEATGRYVIIVDESKLVSRLGETSAIPVEVVSFAWTSTVNRLAGLGLTGELRGGDSPFITDSRNYIVDCTVIPDTISSYQILADRMKLQTGVVEHGLFLEVADMVIVGLTGGEVRVLSRAARRDSR